MQVNHLRDRLKVDLEKGFPLEIAIEKVFYYLDREDVRNKTTGKEVPKETKDFKLFIEKDELYYLMKSYKDCASFFMRSLDPCFDLTYLIELDSNKPDMLFSGFIPKVERIWPEEKDQVYKLTVRHYFEYVKVLQKIRESLERFYNTKENKYRFTTIKSKITISEAALVTLYYYLWDSKYDKEEKKSSALKTFLLRNPKSKIKTNTFYYWGREFLTFVIKDLDNLLTPKEQKYLCALVWISKYLRFSDDYDDIFSMVSEMIREDVELIEIEEFIRCQKLR